MTSVRVMTWNIQGGLAVDGHFAIGEQRDFLKAQAPDIVLLQEVQDVASKKAQGVDQTETLARGAGMPYHSFWLLEDFRGMRTGLALLSRWPLTAIEETRVERPWYTHLPWSYEGQRGILSADVIVDGQTWRVRSTHVTHHVHSEYMANHMSLLAQQAAQTPASVWPVLGGDFNRGQDDPLAARLLESMTVVAGSGIDLIWVGKHETYKSSEPTTVPCGQLSDHDPTAITLEILNPPPPNLPLPPPSAELVVRFAPVPLVVPSGREGSVQVTVTALDAKTGEPKAGIVRVDPGSVGGTVTSSPTGHRVSVPFRKTVRVDPVTKEHETTFVIARVTVSVAGYRDKAVDWDL